MFTMNNEEQEIIKNQEQMIEALGKDNEYWRKVAAHWQEVAEHLMALSHLRTPSSSIICDKEINTQKCGH